MSDIYGPAPVRSLPARSSPDTAAGATHRVQNGRPDTASLPVILAAIERLELAIDQETEALQQGRQGDLRDFNTRKSQGLLDLTRAARALSGDAAAAAAPRLKSLRVKLERNSSVLRAHLAAVQEVSAIMAGVLRDADSDGTYELSRHRN